MIPLSPALPALSSEALSLYYANEPLFEDLPVLIFYGPSTMANSTQNPSRIQAHVYSLAGFQTFPRLTIAPTLPLYAAVTHLEAELQGEEVYRGLAVALLSYFAALPKGTKTVLRELAGSRRVNHQPPMMFDEMHAGELASKMVHVEKAAETAAYLMSALTRRALSWVDVDLLLPCGSITRTMSGEGEELAPPIDDNGQPFYDYGRYNAFIESFGSPAFLPTSQLQRAPSKPTAHNKSKILSKDQKVLLRREMCEFVDTENSYLSKLRNLVLSVAEEFRQNTTSEIWHQLFPESLSKILNINEIFYREIQAILDTTESDAIRDIEGDGVQAISVPETVTQGRRRDPTGAALLAKSALKWFPLFKEPYQDYLRASNQLPHVIAQALTDTSSRFGQHLQLFGEQHLRSALIEPVQRLPRYSLLIDNVVNLLPASHPALVSFVKARDIITDICALDVDECSSATGTLRILQNIVPDWPERLYLQGRLIVVADVNELAPPYTTESQSLAAIMLAFPGKLVILRKSRQDALSARGLLAKLDHPSILTGRPSSWPDHDPGLRLDRIYQLENLSVTESENGHLIQVGELPPMSMLSLEAPRRPTRVFQMQAPYHGKASRLTEAITKARIEARYPQHVREGGKWSLRSLEPSEKGIGIITAISEMDEPNSLQDRGGGGQVRVVVDAREDIKSIMTNTPDSHIVACIMASENGGYVLEIEGLDRTRFVDGCDHERVVPLFQKRLEELLRLQYQAHETGMAQQHISYDRNILRTLPLADQQKESRHRNIRPRSPVKLLSNMLGGTATQSITSMKSRSRALTIESLPQVPLMVNPKDFVTSTNSETNGSKPSKVALVEKGSDASKSPLALLEETLVAYIVALRSRSGNVVGKILQARASADEVSVNELYNILLEDPSKFEAAAIVSVDVLFAAFEKFLRRAWRERMGPVLAPSLVKDMQSNFDAGKPTIFTQHFKQCLEEMSPQNGRAFAAIVKLLSDLLDASGNDGDRGVLIASFAEALILVGDPHEYIMLLDRVVEDYDSLFDEIGATDGPGGSTTSAASSLSRTRSFNTGSLSSNASSLRRKFGLGGALSRENSKNESESKVVSIWRTLSKTAKNPADNCAPISLSKASLVRSRSTDTDVRMLPPSRPVSRDRPPTSGSNISDSSHSRPASSHLNMSGLSSIGEDTPSKASFLPPKKKRRSSLSDLQNLKSPDLAATIGPMKPHKGNDNRLPETYLKTLPRTPSPSKHVFEPQSGRRSPQMSGVPPRLGFSKHKENWPSREQPTSKKSPPSGLRSPPKLIAMPKSDAVTITSYIPEVRRTDRSNLPTSRAGLSERARAANDNVLSSTKPRSPKKMRVQSPQKLRQRLVQEQATASTIKDSLQAEMEKIGEELCTLKRLDSSLGSPSKAFPMDLRLLTSRLESLESQLKCFTKEYTAKNSSFHSDIETSVLVSDTKARELDELYKEANAENEALYDRFNDELGKILARVRKGDGVEEMKVKLGEVQSEVRRLTGENAKLKRENVGLRSMLKDEWIWAEG